MLRKMHLITVLLLLSLGISSSYAMEINQNTADNGIQINYFGPAIGQSFTATDIDIGIVGVRIHDMNPAYSNQITLGLYSGDGIYDYANLLLEKVFNPPDGYMDYLDLDVSALNFSVDSIYTIWVYDSNPNWGISIKFSGNPYSGGQAYWNSGLLQPQFVDSTLSDLRFHVLPGTTNSVPEPASMLLLGSGLTGLVGLRRKLKK